MPKLSKAQQKLPPFDLKAEREKHDLTQAECAVMLFTTQSSVARWEDTGDMPQVHREYWNLYWKTNRPVKGKASGKKASS
jgi:transcriptional regulator with XRE-family HTH domain